MKTEKYFVLYAGISYEPGMLVGIFSSLEAAETHVKSGNVISADYYEIYECEIDKPFRSWGDCKAVRAFE
jgi:hypothetical protein